MSILDDVSILGKIGMFVILFIVCIVTFTAFIDMLMETEEDLGIPSSEVEYNKLNYVLGFSILIGIGGMVLMLMRSKKRSREAEELEAHDRAVLRRYYRDRER